MPPLPISLAIAANSLYHELDKKLSHFAQGYNLCTLVQTLGPWPSWKLPNNDTRISPDTNAVYVVDPKKSFTIALLRTNVEDRPLAIETPEYITGEEVKMIDLLQKAMHQESLSLESAKIYGSFDDLADQIYNPTDFPKFCTTIFAISAKSKPKSLQQYSNPGLSFKHPRSLAASSSRQSQVPMPTCRFSYKCASLSARSF
ncbi:hypothetical protein CPB86DRAFT_602502 [Serendipita vermifera]|nr:hypothetical protein CPB86DRAFT_602502 [Serendipita vermifera]